MKLIKLSLCVIFFPILIYSQEYSVQSYTKGFSLTGDIGILRWNSNDLNFEEESGFYYGAQGLYGITHNFAIYFQARFASIVSKNNDLDNYPLTDLNLGLRYFFGGNTTKWKPFVGLHVNHSRVTTPVTYYSTGDIYEMSFKGFAFGGSTGLHYFFTTQLSIHAVVQANFGTSNDVVLEDYQTHEQIQINDKFDYSTLSFGVGLTYNFLK